MNKCCEDVERKAIAREVRVMAFARDAGRADVLGVLQYDPCTLMYFATEKDFVSAGIPLGRLAVLRAQ